MIVFRKKKSQLLLGYTLDSISLDIESNFADNDSVCKKQRFVTLEK